MQKKYAPNDGMGWDGTGRDALGALPGVSVKLEVTSARAEMIF